MYHAKNISQNNHVFFGKELVINGVPHEINVNTSKREYFPKAIQSFETIANFIHKKFSNFVNTRQLHTNKVLFIDKPTFIEIIADGIVTNNKELVLCVRTADCAPILFMDKTHRVIGACHAGWRGALNGVIQNTISMMIEHGAKLDTIVAAVGPLLQKESFDCKQDMRNSVLQKDANFIKFFESYEDGYKFDFQSFVVHMLKKAGLKNITTSNIDTFTNNDYPSFRRDGFPGAHNLNHANLIYLENSR